MLLKPNSVKRNIYLTVAFCRMNELPLASQTRSTLWKELFLPGLLKRVYSAYLDLLRLASAAAAWSSWVDLLTGTPKMVLWVTSLRIRLWPLFGAIFGDEGGVKEPALCISLPGVCNEKQMTQKVRFKKATQTQNFSSTWKAKQNLTPNIKQG